MVLFIVSEGRTICFSQGGQILYFKGQLYRLLLGQAPMGPFRVSYIS